MMSGRRFRTVAMMMGMPSGSALPPKKNRPAERGQGHHEQRAGVYDHLRNSGPRGNQCAKRILFGDTECTGQKTWSHNHGVISIFTGTFSSSSVALVSSAPPTKIEQAG
jgi:hypothetical protein